MTVIIAVVIFWALFVVGVLVGLSVHGEATGRRTGRPHRAGLERDRAPAFAYRTPVRAPDPRL